MNPIDIQYTQEEFKTLTSYRIFSSAMKPRVQLFNAMKNNQINTLLSKFFP